MAFLFICTAAFIFAGFFTIAGVIGWQFIKPSVFQPKQGKGRSQMVPVSRHVSNPHQQPKSQPLQPFAHQPEQARHEPKTAASRQLPTDPKERFELGLKQCFSRTPEKFPCAWQDTQAGVIKQFKMEKPEEPIVRRVFDMGGKLLNIASFNTQGRYVLMYREGDTNWFFDRNEVVRQISRPSQTVEGKVQDYYYYTATGKLNSCLCADKTQDCCSGAPQLTSPGNRFCELFPLDAEFCVK